MAMNSDAILRIRANVSGVETIDALSRQTVRAAQAADGAVPAYGRLGGSLRGVAVAMEGFTGQGLFKAAEAAQRQAFAYDKLTGSLRQVAPVYDRITGALLPANRALKIHRQQLAQASQASQAAAGSSDRLAKSVRGLGAASDGAQRSAFAYDRMTGALRQVAPAYDRMTGALLPASRALQHQQAQVTRAAQAMQAAGPAATRMADAVAQGARVYDRLTGALKPAGWAMQRYGEQTQQASQSTGRASSLVDRLNQSLRGTGGVVAGIGLDRLGQNLQAMGSAALEAGERSYLLERRIKALAGAHGEVQRLTQFSTQAAERYGLSQLDAADAVSGLYGRLRPMGISLKDIETTFIGVNNAGKLAGLSMYDTKEAFRQLSQAMGSGRLQGDEFRSIMERMPQIGVAIADAFNRIAQSKGLKQISRENANAMIEEVKNGEARQIQVIRDGVRQRIREVQNGEKGQTDAIRREADERIALIEKETDRQITEINRRYQRQEQLLSDQFQDQEDAERRAADRGLENQLEAIDDRYEAQRRGIERELDARRDAIQQDESLSEEARRELLYRLQDQSREVLDQLRDAQDEENQVLRDAHDERMRERNRQLRDEQQMRRQALEDQQSAEVELQRNGAAKQRQVIEDGVEERLQLVKEEAELQRQAIESGADQQIEATKKQSKAAQSEIMDRTTVVVADLKRLASEGKLTTDILLEAMNGLVNLKPPPPTELERFRAALGDLRMEMGDNLLPMLTPIINGFTALTRAFNGLPEPVQGVIVAIGGITLAVTALSIALAPLVYVLGAAQGLMAWFAGAGLAGLIAGNLARLQPLVAFFGTTLTPLVIGAFQGIIGWLGSVFLPAAIAFFSGPAGWVTLAVIAVGAMAYAFREPIMGFLGWLGEQLALVPGYFMGLGEQLKAWLGGLIESMRLAIDPFIQGFLQGTNDLLVAIQTAWNSAPQFFSDIWSKITQAVTTRINELRALGKGLADFFVSIPDRIATAFRTGFQAAVNSIKGVINTVLRGAGNAINSFIQSVNNMVASISRISAKVGISLSYIPTVAIPQFATGAFVTGPTIGRVGEAGDEYIIPANQMERATQNFQRGRRGAAVLNSNPGPSRSGPVNVSVNFSGQVIDLGNGRRAVTMEDVVGLLEANNAAIMDAMGEAPMQLAVRGF